MTILQVSIPKLPRKVFDYLPPAGVDATHLQVGCRLRVPFRHSTMIGILVAISEQSTVAREKLKPAQQLLDTHALFSSDVMRLCRFASQYYHYPLGEVLSVALPKYLRDGRAAQVEQQTLWFLTEQGKQVDPLDVARAVKQQQALQLFNQYSEGLSSQILQGHGISRSVLNALRDKTWLVAKQHDVMLEKRVGKQSTELTLNDEQTVAVDQISQHLQQHATFLLDGVTGSGKTEVYLQVIQKVLEAGKQCLILVPEIGLTPQTFARFEERFVVPVTMLHSGLNDSERCTAWMYAKRGDAKIIIGTRSAVFTPMMNLGLIVVDEEHDSSFKQQESFRYSARDLAVVRASLLSIPVILGSATPSLESLYNATHSKRYQLLTLQARAGNAHQPDMHVIDIRTQRLQSGLSQPLLQAIERHVQAGNQVMLFINRRGYAPVLMCHQCGWVAGCKDCDAHLTIHYSPHYLQCHHCGYTQAVVQQCQQCSNTEVQPVGIGTERVEDCLTNQFPDITTLRIDRDSTRRKGSLHELLNQIHAGGPKILIGTQMLAKGHHFPDVTMVAILNADSGFFSSDFRASERLGQLLLQVSGRAGRADKKGEVYIQTHHPDHPLLQQLLTQGYRPFAESILQERLAVGFPPHGYLALFRSQAEVPQTALDLLETIKQMCQPLLSQQLQLLGPVPAPMEKRAGQYRSQLLLQSNDRSVLHNMLQQVLPMIRQNTAANKVRWSLDIDPIELF